jgi:hypothetical protein
MDPFLIIAGAGTVAVAWAGLSSRRVRILLALLLVILAFDYVTRTFLYPILARRTAERFETFKDPGPDPNPLARLGIDAKGRVSVPRIEACDRDLNGASLPGLKNEKWLAVCRTLSGPEAGGVRP